MLHKPTTFTEFLVASEKENKDATGDFTMLLLHIESAAKIIASAARSAGLTSIIGSANKTNASSDEVKKIDVFSNELLIETLKSSGLVGYIGSEELEETIVVNKHGEYNVFFDPLDGSSNFEINGPTGCIFSIYHNTAVLQPGNKQVAAGYILFGASTLFVYSAGNGVHEFTLDPSVGSFFLSRTNITMPQKGSFYSINEYASPLWDKPTTDLLAAFKNQGYKGRYFACAVADVHRTILKGGIFLYPQDSHNTNGKLRLLYEVNPLSFLIQQASGKALSLKENPLNIVPTSVHQRVPVAMGSTEEIAQYEKSLL